MTNLDLIKAGSHPGFNNLLEKSICSQISDMLSALNCELCICRDFCCYHSNNICQEIIDEWLNNEYIE